MKDTASLREFLTTYSPDISLITFIVNLLLTAIISYLVALVYIKYGRALSNRTSFSKNFVILGVTTMLVISIVKSSLALSLGLVGALSIVRFRAAIKEPEELSYLFLIIGAGLGFGANQRLITLTAFVLIFGILIVQNVFGRRTESENLYLTVTNAAEKKLDATDIVSILNRHCTRIQMTRFVEDEDMMEATFLIKFDSFDAFNTCKLELQSLDEGIKLNFLERHGLV